MSAQIPNTPLGPAGSTPPRLESLAMGMAIDGSDPAVLDEALRLAFDYRGDVTLHLRSGRVVDGFIYDRRTRPDRAVRILVRDSDERLVVPDGDVLRLEVTGRDTAAGKTFENWVKRYVEKKLRGEAASIESESL
jgi:hypothetical protein